MSSVIILYLFYEFVYIVLIVLLYLNLKVMGAVKRVKNVEWEKNRRERLNLTFVELSRLLPDHDPTLTLTKLEILNKSILYIKELQERNTNLLHTNCSDILEAEMTSLREQVAELQRRNQQLADLLQTAKISLPPRPLRHTTPLVFPLKWTGKLPSDAKLKNTSENKKGETKENPIKSVVQPKSSAKKKSMKIKKKCKTKVHKRIENKTKTVTVSISINPLRELNNTSSVPSVPASSQSSNGTSVSHSVKSSAVSVAATSVKNSDPSATVGSASVPSTPVLPRTETVPCTTISLVLANSKTNIVSVAKSNVLPAPIMATGIQSMLQCNPSLSSLGPGTLIMANGRIVPVPPSPAILTPTLILLPPMTSAVAVTTTKPPPKPSNGFRTLVPKMRHRDITKTTFANKVPIPAISTCRRELSTGVKPVHNNREASLDGKKSVNKKCVVSKHSVKEKLCETLKDKMVESSQETDSEISKSKSVNDIKCLDKAGTFKKSDQVEQCVKKRKSAASNEHIKDPKVAKVVKNPVDTIISCEDSNKPSQESSGSVSTTSLTKQQTDIDSVKELKINKCPETISNSTELPEDVHKDRTIHKSNKELSISENIAISEDTPSGTGSVVRSQNEIEKDDLVNTRKQIDSEITERNTNVNSVLFSSEKNSEKAAIKTVSGENNVDQTPGKRTSQISVEITHQTAETGTLILKTRNAESTESCLSETAQQLSNVNVNDHSERGNKQYVLMGTSHVDIDKNNKQHCRLTEITQNANKNVVLGTNDPQLLQDNSGENLQQKSEILVTHDSKLIVSSQQVSNTTPSVSNSVNNATLVSSVGFDETVSHGNNKTSMLPFNGSEHLILKSNNVSNPAVKNQPLNVNCKSFNNGIGNQSSVGSQIFTNDSLNVGENGNLVLQSNLTMNKSNNIQLTSVREQSDESCKMLRSDSSREEYAPKPSMSKTIFTSPEQQNSSICKVENKHCHSKEQFNVNTESSSVMKTVTSAGQNSQNLLNSRNNCFNSQQTTLCAKPCLDLVQSKNNPNLFPENYHFNEGIQHNKSNKIAPVSSSQSSLSFNFQTASNNNIRVVSEINVQPTNSGNFYTNVNCPQHQSSGLNVLGNKFIQNTTPVSRNYNFIKTHPSPDVNANSKMNISNSSTGQINFINVQKQNSHANNSLTSSEMPRNITETTFNLNDQGKKVMKSMNTCNSVQSHIPTIGLKGSNQSQINISVDASKSISCPNQQHVSKSVENSSKLQSETVKISATQSCKSTQVTSLQLNFVGNEKQAGENKQHTKQNTINNTILKKSASELKATCENKSLMQDDSQELTSLFPTEKLQSCSENLFRDSCSDFRDRNLFMPVGHSYMDEMRLNLPHSDFSNDLLSSLQVPNTGQHPESISPTAAFLLAFPLVSTSKNSELITENEGGESQHATPTTILQIGNIEPSNNELFHQTALMMESNQNMVKQNKPVDTNKDNSSKQLKDIENFNKFQQMEINELMRNENFSRNNFKEKKTFVGLSEQDMFYPCTKKKSNGKSNNYHMPSAVVPHVQDKAFEFSESNIRINPEQDRQVNNNEKKIQAQPENPSNPQNIYNSSSQPYTYSSFASGNEFMLPTSNYPPSNSHSGIESSKSVSLASSNFNVISWSTASITSNSGHIDYTTPYSGYSQKQYSNPNQIKMQKTVQTNFDDQRLKEKSSANMNSLPKFSNFHFNNNHSNQDIHGYAQSNQTDNSNYKPESKSKKLKTSSQRAPVNWMTTPDVRPLIPEASVAPVLPDVMFQHQKEMDFTSTPNNMMMLNNSSNITSFNISTSMSNNTQTLYPNSHFSGVDLQLDFTPFPEITTTKPSRSLPNAPNNQQNPHHYSWSPSKTSIPLLPHIDSHMIPSTLPTLVGDLALGTTTPSGPIDTFRNLSMPTTPFNIETPMKKFEKKHETQKQTSKPSDKDCFPNSERRNNRTASEYCQKTHSHQSTNTSSSFLSVSQLVDQVKTEQSTSSRRTNKQTGTKANNSSQKRNTGNLQAEKAKITNTNNQNNYHNSNPGMMNQRKFDSHPGVYQEIHNSGVGFPGTFSNQGGVVSWQGDKSHRSTSHYKGSYSAESLIADQSTSGQGHTAELPQFPNQYSHPPVVSSASYPNTDFSHQNVQPLEFHQTHQNCFNFPPNSHYSSGSFNSDGDYHLGLDHLFNFNPTSNKHSTSCQTSAKDNRGSGKRGQNKQRREDFPPQWTPQVYPQSVRPKAPMPPYCPPSTSSPSHQGTTTLTNFNLSTIFPEINDKVGMPGPPPPSHFPPAPNFRPQ